MLIQQILLSVPFGTLFAHKGLLLLRMVLQQLMVPQALFVGKSFVALGASVIKYPIGYGFGSWDFRIRLAHSTLPLT